MAALLSYAQDFRTYEQLREKAPTEVRKRVLLTAARSVGATSDRR